MTKLPELIDQLNDHDFKAHVPVEFLMIEDQDGASTRNLLGVDPLTAIIKEVSADLERFQNSKIERYQDVKDYAYMICFVRDGMICYKKRVNQK